MSVFKCNVVLLRYGKNTFYTIHIISIVELADVDCQNYKKNIMLLKMTKNYKYNDLIGINLTFLIIIISQLLGWQNEKKKKKMKTI